jgi:hypothetical protein
MKHQQIFQFILLYCDVRRSVCQPARRGYLLEGAGLNVLDKLHAGCIDSHTDLL